MGRVPTSKISKNAGPGESDSMEIDKPISSNLIIRQSSIEEKVRTKPIRKKLVLQAVKISKAQKNQSSGFVHSDDLTQEERREKVQLLHHFSSLKKNEVEVSSRRIPLADEKPKLKNLGLLNEQDTRKRKIFEVMGPNGSSHFNEELVVKPFKGMKWAKRFCSLKKNDIYPMSFKQNLLLLINNVDFVKKERRDGSQHDVEKLTCLFEQLRFDIILKENLDAEDMKQQIKEFATRDEHSLADCTVVIVMSHGDDGDIVFGSDDQPVKIRELVDLLNTANAPLLAGKPKIFIIQACRGREPDPGDKLFKPITTKRRRIETKLRHDAGAYLDPNDQLKKFYKPKQEETPMKEQEKIRLATFTHPIDADILIANACANGRAAARHTVNGSWFINCICDIFVEHAKDLHIVDLLTKVNNRLSRHEFDENEFEKQASETITRLTHNFYFFPGVENT